MFRRRGAPWLPLLLAGGIGAAMVGRAMERASTGAHRTASRSAAHLEHLILFTSFLKFAANPTWNLLPENETSC